MKVYISADIEGIAGVVAIDHTKRKGKDYEIARRFMTREVNAAVEGAFSGGADEVVVNDSHGSMINLIVEKLDERINIISGSPKPVAMVQGVENCDIAFFVGYHSCAGTSDAIMDHTYHGRIVYNIRINQKTMGELGINAALAGYFGVPVVLVTGDRKTTQEAVNILKNVEIVSTKEGIGRFSAQSEHPMKIWNYIREKAQKAVKNSNAVPFIVKPPLRLEMDFFSSSMAECVDLLPEIKRIGSRSAGYECDDFLKLYKMMRAMILLASTAVRK